MFYHALTGNNEVTTSVIPFTTVGESDGKNIKINIAADYPDFEELTIDNIYVEFSQLTYDSGGAGQSDYTVSYTYNNTGIITVTTNLAGVMFRSGVSVNGKVIIIKE